MRVVQKVSITLLHHLCFLCQNIIIEVNFISNSRSRKYILTFNNPIDHGVSHESINNDMRKFSFLYYCLADEVGAEENTPHIHLFFCCENAVSFDRVKKIFPSAHIETAMGSAQQNRDYIRKEGKYSDSDKKETNIPDSFEEYGIIPQDKSAKNETISEKVYEMVRDGYSNVEIIEKYPSFFSKISHLNLLRAEIAKENAPKEYTKKTVVYIYGETGTGKTKYIYENYDYDDVFLVSDYKNPFDGYNFQKVLVFDEFHSDIAINEMLRLLDGYIVELRARYGNKFACYNTVYIISNIPLNEQYKYEDTKTYNALIRRIDKVMLFSKKKPLTDYEESNIEIINELPQNYNR